MKRLHLILALVFCFQMNLFSQTNWVKDASNPVLKRGAVFANLPNDIIAISDPWVEKDGATYKI